MTIYTIKIKMPHSGNLTRSQVLSILQNEVRNNYTGVGNFDKCMTKAECKRYYNTLLIEDINNKFIGTLS